MRFSRELMKTTERTSKPEKSGLILDLFNTTKQIEPHVDVQ